MYLFVVILWWILQIYFFILLGRLLIDLLLSANPSWRPAGPLLPLAEIVMTLTDPPLKLLRKVIRPIRLGAVQLDLAWAALVLAISLLQRLVLSFA